MMNQRWREGRDRYRPPGEVIDTSKYEVARIAQGDARAFVERHHYAGSIPPDRFDFGLWRGEQLVGAAVFSVPCNDAALTNVFPFDPREGLELGRLVLLDDVPGNGESFFVARCFAALRREGIAGVISFSDPLPRTNERGETVKRGHIGIVYQALNARYLGRATPRTLRLLADGKVFSDRTAQKIRKQERGWEAAVRELLARGAGRLDGDPREWLRLWLPRITRPLRHPGNFKYAWPLRSGVERFMPEPRPYPKRTS